jgi:hypothetical protein
MPVPVAATGNHDIGDNPRPGSPPGITVDAAHQQRWLDVVAADNWSLTDGGWTLLALNAQLFESGLEAEEQQWSWLTEQVSRCPEIQALGLLSHKPLTGSSAELESPPA